MTRKENGSTRELGDVVIEILPSNSPLRLDLGRLLGRGAFGQCFEANVHNFREAFFHEKHKSENGKIRHLAAKVSARIVIISIYQNQNQNQNLLV